MPEKDRPLSPADRLSEMLCGVIMVMTIIAAARIGTLGESISSRVIITAALGCNIAWGFVDGLLYLFSGIVERGKRVTLMKEIKSGLEEPKAIKAIKDDLEDSVVDGLDEETKSRLAAMVYSGMATAQPSRPNMSKKDVRGALSIFMIDFVTAFCLVLPFFFLHADVRLALEISNGLGLGMLFFIGRGWAKYTNRKKLLSGLLMMVIGLVIVGLTFALGG
jgi:VIT1/CCC1 family predicted Fe2+/Mn2+ transporter